MELERDQQKEQVQAELALDVPKEPRQRPEDQLALHMAHGNREVAARIKRLPLFRVALHGHEVVTSTPLLPGRTGWVTSRQKGTGQ